MLREPTPPALEVIAGASRRASATCRSSRWATCAHETAARAAGASDFLRTPTYIRDVVNVAKLNAYGDDGEGLLSEYHGLFYLLRAMSATARTRACCGWRADRGARRSGSRTARSCRPASARCSTCPRCTTCCCGRRPASRSPAAPVAKPSQFPLSAQEVLDECERFLRDFAHAARDLGPPEHDLPAGPGAAARR